jgi:hypothetical protein
MKTIPTFEFIDEPQYRTPMSREETANRLRSYRCRSNGNHKRYCVTTLGHGQYNIHLRYTDSPVALITTK